MRTLLLQITLRIPWAHSLKEKRMVAKSLIQKLRNTFNASVAETDTQDAHQLLTIGIAAIVHDAAAGSALQEAILRFIESRTDAELMRVQSEYA